MASNVQIVNAALLRIGELTITSFEDPGKPALLANNTFEIHRDSLLRSIPWRFAIKRTSLAASTTDPEWEFDSAYPLPSDCLRVLTIENLSDYDWRVEGNRIVTDIGTPIYLKYIYKVTDPNEFDSLFTETLVAKLQWEWAEALQKDASLRADLLTEYVGKRSEAATINGSEGMNEPLPSGSWYLAHLS